MDQKLCWPISGKWWKFKNDRFPKIMGMPERCQKGIRLSIGILGPKRTKNFGNDGQVSEFQNHPFNVTMKHCDLRDGSWWHLTAINYFLFSFNLHCFYLCFLLFFEVWFLFQNVNFKVLQCVWSVALSTVGFCTAWMRQNQILVLPNRDLGFGMTTFLTSVVFNETKKLRRRKKYGGG